MTMEQIEIESNSITASLLSLQALLRQTDDPDIKTMVARQLDVIEEQVIELEEKRDELNKKLVIQAIFDGVNSYRVQDIG